MNPVGRARSHPERANTLEDAAAATEQIRCQRSQGLHRIELRLIGQPDRSGVRERHVEGVNTLDLQAQSQARVILAVDGRKASPGSRIAIGVVGLDRNAMLGAVALEPGLAFSVGLDVGGCLLLGVVPEDVGQPRALEEADLGGRVAGCDGTDRPRLQDSDVPASTGQ